MYSTSLPTVRRMFVVGVVILVGLAVLGARNAHLVVESASKLIQTDQAVARPVSHSDIELPSVVREQSSRELKELQNQAWRIVAALRVGLPLLVALLLTASWLVRREFSERQMADNRLQERDAHYRLLADNSDDFVVLNDTHGGRLYVSPSYHRVTGWTLEDLQTTDWRTRLHPDDLPTIERMQASNLAGEATLIEHRIRCRDGSWIWVELRCKPRVDADGRVIQLLQWSRDITDRKRVELELRASQSSLEMAQAITRVGSWEFDPVGRTGKWSKEMFRLFDRDPARGTPTFEEFLEIVHPDDRNVLLDANAQVAQAENTVEVSYRVSPEFGGLRYFDGKVHATRDASGRVTQLNGTLWDVTELKLAELALHDSSNRLRMMLEQLPAALWTTDRELTITSSTGAALKALGLRSGQLVGTPLVDYVQSKDPNFLPISSHLKALEGKTVEYEMTWMGLEFWAYLEPLRDADGQIIGVLGISVDVTELKRTNEALRERDSQYRLLADNTDDFVKLLDLNGTRLYVSPSYFRITGWTMDELLNSDWRTRMNAEDLPQLERARDAALAGETTMLEHRIRCKDGSWFWVELRFKPIRDQHGRVTQILQVGRDITARKRVNEELLVSRNRLAELSRKLITAQEDERRHVAHELHDEVGQVLTAVGMALHHLKPLCSHNAVLELEGSQVLIQQAMIQIRELSMNLRPSLLDIVGLDAAVRECVSQHRKLTGSDVELNVQLDSRLPPDLEITCYRVIQSALTNIARHAQASQVSVDIRSKDCGIELIVRDNGIGMDLATVRQRAGQGGSFGILAMQERVQLAGGTLRIDSASTPGAGTSICALLPVGS